MTTANASCPLAIAPATIAAWRDGALPGDESARIAAHVSGCEACRREIALYESLDDALRRQPVPQSDGSLWRAVRAGMDNTHRPRNTRWTVRRVAGAATALAAVLLLALGFAQIFQARGNVIYHPSSTTTSVQGTPTPLPTAGPASPAVRVAAPAWQPGNFPTSGITFGERSDDILTFGVAPSVGATAYACYGQSNQAGSQVTMYRTSDRAVHWTRLTQFSLPHIQTSDCTVQVDALDANRALVSIWGQNMQNFQDVRFHELTEDGGATWTKLSYDNLIYGITTVKGRTYAIRIQAVGVQRNGQPLYIQHLAVSTDHLRSWQTIDTDLTDSVQNEGVWRFWARPDGELLAQATTTVTTADSRSTSSTTGRALWLSDDGGAHWRPFPMPTLTSGLSTGADDMFTSAWLVQQPTTSQQPWHVCIHEMVKGGNVTMGIACTADSGHTWSVRPYLCQSAPCSTDGAAATGTEGETLTADGSLLFIVPDKSLHLGLYRLPAHSSLWEYLGPANGSNAFFYAPTSASDGVIWLYAGGIDMQASLSGVIGGHLGSLPSVLLSTATYP